MNNKGLKIALAISIILILVLGGYIVYDKLILKEDNKVEEKLDNEKNKGAESESGNETQTEDPETDVKEDSYQKYLKKLNSNKEEKNVTLSSYVDGTDKYLVLKDGHLHMRDDVGGTVQVINNKIVDFLFVDKISQSEADFLFILDENGDVYYVASSFDWTDNFAMMKPKKIEELKEIVSVNTYEKCNENGGCYYTGDFIDFNGNRTSVVSILEKYNLAGDAW